MAPLPYTQRNTCDSPPQRSCQTYLERTCLDLLPGTLPASSSQGWGRYAQASAIVWVRRRFNTLNVIISLVSTGIDAIPHSQDGADDNDDDYKGNEPSSDGLQGLKTLKVFAWIMVLRHTHLLPWLEECSS
jgi:hypothetical protein